VIGPELLAQYDPKGVSCVNLNTPKEYHKARKTQRT
jgi:hypothetical protein